MLVEVYDGVGRKIYEEKRTNYTEESIIPMDIGEVTAGIYFVKIRNKEGQIVRKVIKI